ncbi:helix-turn-helix domain-containing protein [Epidermidibacterium keratini]|uniref:Helix-turn-helix domain-containing protein n=1 Tax=Epidermidibacterium keratini TaxID=1891644 RepID=A0A7L4YLL8_9ACTN|nr:helix-turn-helix transcriptional regulator [Epidermidibacterium keratini]QHB99446.1 helix-turn-helix domain-containing protein [Epidermidibacterium keratini]
MPKHRPKRAIKTPPHVSLKALRQMRGWTLDKLIAEIAGATGANYQRGTISAIESGLRGASAKAISDIAAAYRIDPDLITTDYRPRDAFQSGRGAA